MKKYLITILLITATYLAGYELKKDNDNILISGETDYQLTNLENEDLLSLKVTDLASQGKPGAPLLPVYSKLISLPDQGNYQLNSDKSVYKEVKLSKELLYAEGKNIKIQKEDRWYPEKNIKISKPAIMHGERFSQISINPVQYNPVKNKIRVMQEVKLDFILNDKDRRNSITKKRSELKSGAFTKLFKEQIAGYQEVKSNKLANYLIVAPTALENALQPLVTWKRRLGFETELKLIDTNDPAEVKNLIQESYNSELPPDYVLLVGDSDGNYVIPAFYVPNDYGHGDIRSIAADHYYALLEGDDFLPDVYLGRISIQNLDQLNTVLSKIINYEGNPFQESNWFQKADMIAAADFASSFTQSGEVFNSAKETVLAVKEMLLDKTYNQVEVITSLEPDALMKIYNQINEGCSVIAFRGNGGDNWPSVYMNLFEKNDILNLNNGFMLPAVVSITCGGSAFDHHLQNFGETWLSAGSATMPKGAIGFIGISDNNTQTIYNNTNTLGLFQGFSHEGLTRMGEMLTRGKMELYTNFPDCHEMGTSVESIQFYFYTTTLLGDPGLNVWSAVPKTLDFIYEESITADQNFLKVSVTPEETEKENFIISVTDNNGLYARGLTDSNGVLNLPIDLTEGNYKITVSKQDYIPLTKDLVVEKGNSLVLDQEEYTIDTGETKTLNFSLKNLGDTASGEITYNFSSESELLDFNLDSSNLSSLESGSSLTIEHEFTITNNWLDGHLVELFLNISSDLGEKSFLIPLKISAPAFEYQEATYGNNENYLVIGSENSISLKMKNTGSEATGNITFNLASDTEQATITSGSVELASIQAESEVEVSRIKLTTSTDLLAGEIISLKYEIYRNSEKVQEGNIELVAGLVTEDSQTLSGSGYKAIESRDPFAESPAYEWQELSFISGGPGELLIGDYVNTDGYTKKLDLPFTFKFFGEDYNQIVVSSSGLVSFGAEQTIFVRNRTIPSGVGPRAMIAPLWDKYADGNVFYYYDENEHVFIVEWKDMVSHYNENYRNTFQVLLYDPEMYPTVTGDGQIKFQYKEVNNIDEFDNYATVGIENYDQTEGLLITYANRYAPSAHELANETAILISPELADKTLACKELKPEKTELKQNYPNPFNPVTSISYSLAEKANIKLAVYNAKGQMVKLLANGRKKAGYHTVKFDGAKLNSGIYFYSLSLDGKVHQLKKMILVK